MSMRRRDESLFSQQLTELSASIKGLQTQMATMHSESAELRAEIAQLRVEKAESDEVVRQARAERAKAQLAERSDSGDWIDAWVASLRTSGELDLTMHDETIELEFEADIVVGVGGGRVLRLCGHGDLLPFVILTSMTVMRRPRGADCSGRPVPGGARPIQGASDRPLAI